MNKIESLHIDPRDMETLFRVCINSKQVRDNDRYRQVADNTEFTYDDMYVVNAYANRDGDKYTVCIYRGICEWSSMFSFIAMALENKLISFGQSLKMVRWVVKLIRRLSNDRENVPDDLFARLVHYMCKDCKVNVNLTSQQVELWYAYTKMVSLTVVAHELGHCCLGHCDDAGYDGTIMSANRNIERQADLFAYSIVQYGGYGTIGAVCAVLQEMSLLVFSTDKYSENTHPASYERVENAFRSFEGQFAKTGPLTAKNLHKLVDAIVSEGSKK